MNLNVQLRRVEDADHEWLVELHNDPLVLRNITHPNPITLAQHLAWWSGIERNVTEERLIFQVSGQRIGFTKFYTIDRENQTCLLGADIHHSYRGRGLAKTMWKAMLDHAFTNLDLYRVSLTVAEFNEVGLRVYRGVGFREEGRLLKALLRGGERFDQVCMYLLREDWSRGVAP